MREPVAQSVEQLTFNQRVAGSIPARLTKDLHRSRMILLQGFLQPCKRIILIGAVVFLDIAQLIASFATAVGVLFAAMQFVSDRRERKAAFTMDRVDRMNAALDALLITDVVAHLCKWRRPMAPP